MIIHRSNRTEELIAELAALVDAPGLDPFAPETLVVQGRGMERWLSMQLADRLGVWANPEILSPRRLLDSIFKRVLGSEIDPAFDPESLMWSVADLLPGLLEQEGFETIRRYLELDGDGRKRIQLSYQIANIFYRYMTYRPEMMVAWQNPARSEFADPDVRWQATLWRALIERLGTNHLADRADAFVKRLARGDFASGCLPVRVSIFGVSSLPRLYLDLFTALSKRLELHLFVLSPSREYWADIPTPHELRRELRRSRSGDETLLHLDGSHPLLASLGHLGRDFQRMIEDEGSYQEAARDLYRDPLDEGHTMLGVLQSDILNLRARGGEDAAALPLDPADRSIRVHACHSPMREVEVLREELLASFEADPTLEPQDVVVMTPDIETYAPYIEAVFGIRSREPDAVARGEGAIPCRISDRGPLHGDPVVEAFRRGLDFIRGRFAAAEALDLLALECVRRRFGFEARDLEIVKAWILASGIRWGIDASHRESLDQPGSSENTWRFGLDRLLLGVAVPDDRRSLFRDVRPLDGVEGQNAERLGRVLDFCEFFFVRREKLEAPRSPGQWRDVLLEFLNGLAECNDRNLEQHLLVRRVLNEIADQAAAADFRADISLESMREQIEGGLDHARTSSRFLSGGVTFCELVPMRSIPFRVVCLLGMNDEAFPRVRHSLGFDLVAKNPRVGDRTVREDDRYLFLEALLAARERLVISFVGQSVRDGSVLPPSVVVSELLDALAESFAIEGTAQRDCRERIREAVLIQHPLQPFSPRYFDRGRDLRIDVHSALYCDSAERLMEARHPDPPFFKAALLATAPEEDGGVEDVDLDQLLGFFRHPSRHFLRHRMGISLREDPDELALREPFDLNALDEFQLGSQLLDLIRSGAPDREAYAVLRGSGRLPHGLAGRVAFDELLGNAVSMVGQVRELTRGETLSCAGFSIEIAGARLSGALPDLGPRGQVICRFSKLGRAAELGAWIRHLVLHVAATDSRDRCFAGLPLETFFVGRPEKRGGATIARFTRPEAPGRELAELVRLYRVGMTAPLPLFPRASRTYTEGLRSGSSGKDALREVKKNYEQSGRFKGEGLDPYHALAFRGADLFDPAARLACDEHFEKVAETVFAPLLSAREEGV